jgi:hypothetical protein
MKTAADKLRILLKMRKCGIIEAKKGGEAVSVWRKMPVPI